MATKQLEIADLEVLPTLARMTASSRRELRVVRRGHYVHLLSIVTDPDSGAPTKIVGTTFFPASRLVELSRLGADALMAERHRLDRFDGDAAKAERAEKRGYAQLVSSPSVVESPKLVGAWGDGGTWGDGTKWGE